MFFNTFDVGFDPRGWDTSNAETMAGMFHFAQAFSGDVGRWNTSKVTTFENMFAETSFQISDLSGWDTSKVTSFAFMFSGTRGVCPPENFMPGCGEVSTTLSFDLSTWKTSSATTFERMFYGLTSTSTDTECRRTRPRLARSHAGGGLVVARAGPPWLAAA